MTTVIVSGAVANKHRHGGSVWVRMSWAEGLRAPGSTSCSSSRSTLRTVSSGGRSPPGGGDRRRPRDDGGLRLRGAGGVRVPGRGDVHGMDRAELLDARRRRGAAGQPQRPPALARCCGSFGRGRTSTSIPGFTQIWHAAGPRRRRRRPRLPLHGRREHRAPRAVRSRPAACAGGPSASRSCSSTGRSADGGSPRFTTVASWRGPFGPAAWAGRTYGLKAHEFRQVRRPARRCGAAVRARARHPSPATPRTAPPAATAGGRCVDPRVATPVRLPRLRPGLGRRVLGAQGIYVETAAAGSATARCATWPRPPALVQDTGFGGELPVGEGLLAFRTPG